MIESCGPLCVIDTTTSNSSRALMTDILRIHFDIRQRIELEQRKTQITTRGGHLRLDDTAGTSIVPIARLSIITRLFIHMCTCIDDIDVDGRNYESSQSPGLHYACLSLRQFSLTKFVRHTSEFNSAH